MVDTHVLIWADRGDERLGQKSRALVRADPPPDVLAVSAISFWEVGMLIAKRRFSIQGTLSAWRDRLRQMGIVELAVDGEIAIAAAELADLHGDPADRIIVATAKVNRATLMTADRQLLSRRVGVEVADARL